jgi:integrase/recombinase XerC
LIEAKLAPSTINVRLSALKSFVAYARQVEQCSFNLADVTCLKVESYVDTTGIEVAGFREMLQIPDRSTVKGIRDYAILRLLWDNALRRNEICSLDVGDFDRSGRLSILGKGKIQKSQIDLSPATTIAISQWLTARESYLTKDPLFTSLDRRSKGHRLDGSTIYRLVREFSEAAGIDKVVSSHRIRHSAITAYLDASDGNIRAAQGLSRHASLNTLTRYDDNRHKYQAIATNTLADLI